MKFQFNKWDFSVNAKIAVFLLFGFSLNLFGEDLFNGKNIYRQIEAVQVGDVLKLVVDEPVIVEYDYEGDSDDHRTVKLSPDRETFSFLKPIDDDRSFVDKNRSKIRSRVRLRMFMGVRISAINGDVIQFVGQRRLGYENGRLEQQIQSSGSIALRDVSQDRSIQSRHVAELQLMIAGRPIEQRENLQLKEDQTHSADSNEPPKPSAEMNDLEKQQILLEYLNRLLGETGSAMP